MKKITFLSLLLAVSLGYSQSDVLENFDGTAPSVSFADDNNNASAAVSSTEAASGANSLELITTAAGAPWQGAKLLMQNNKIDMRDATTGVGTNKVVTFNLYSTTARRFLVKLSNGDADPAGTDPNLESKTSTVTHGGTGWEPMTADFTVPADVGQPGYNPPTDQFSAIVLFPLFDTAGGDGWDVCCDPNTALVTTTYIDDIVSFAGDAIVVDLCTNGVQDAGEGGIDCGGTCPDACPILPTSAAPTPPNRAAEDVISLFSNAYTDTTIETWNAAFDDSTSEDVVNFGDDIKKITFTNFIGVEFTNNRIDASTMTYFHMDFWTNNTDLVGKVFNSKFSQWGGGASEVSAMELNINDGTTPAVVTGAWVSIDVEIATNFSNNLTRDDLAQFLITSNLGVVYVDNIYFHKNTVLSTDEFSTANFKVYPNPTATNWTISGNSPITKVTVYDILGKKVSTLTSNQNEVEINTDTMSPGMYFAKIESDNGSKTVKLIKQ
ncbi:MAG: T9SS type A sorting domain-containing protein [Psychroserpens sp.]|uniref:T9SS type A sorting domain-containing protein n=1 Tax=Psychroserpens sp. TaxID=2020870 RepID=UPI003001E799